MQTKKEEGKLTIFLIGEIDAQNALEVQEEIEEILKTRGDDELIFDAKELKYISSAGLRIILSVKKKIKTGISVINLSTEVLEIFKLAGFQHLTNIKGA